MNEHGIINGILVFVGVIILVARIIKKLGGAPANPQPQAPQQPKLDGVTRPAVTPPALVPRRRLVMAGPAALTPAVAPPVADRAPFAPRTPAPSSSAMPPMGYVAEAAAAFPGLDLTLPDAEAPGAPVQPRRAGRTFRGNVMPGERGWGANAVVAMEILGPPVSLRSGATLGAPHAF
jgi:hypothetical protein